MRMKKPFVLLIFGPTAVGKTSFALEIARHIPVEIINGDSGQLYEPLSIGTAKPNWKKEPTPHLLFDVINEPRHFSVVEYRTLLLKTIQEVFSRGNLPIVVGGSGFYLKSIFFPPPAGDIASKEMQHTKGEKDLWQALFEVDPDRAKQIHKGDTYRIKRALAIWEQTGKKPSEFTPVFCPPIDFSLVYLSRDRNQLFERINMRTGQMMDEGWPEEVAQLKGTPWEPFLQKKKFIGYDVLLDYLSCPGEDNLKKAIAIIQKRTRHYAKRQETFWKSFERQLNEALEAYSGPNFYGETRSVNLTLLDRDLYIEQLLKMLRVHIK